MQNIQSHKELEHYIKKQDKSFLLLYKKGSNQSDCAYDQVKATDANVLVADLNTVKDIHMNYQIQSVPALLEFENGKFVRVVKGCHDTVFYKSIFEARYSKASAKGENKSVKNIILYSTPSCTYCTTIKSYFRINNITFKEVDVSVNAESAKEMVRKSGQQGVPQTYINGRLVMGYDKNKLDELLEISK
ncbi:MAG: hypothetical protein JEZ03_11355 [Bacteroidales bacterium]|nr:hypothetical protein [Bacteroidales bacterium]